MKFVWVASINRFRRTETEVKKERLKYEVVEFETDKDSLIDRFNAYEERIEALQAQLSGGAQPAVVETPELEPDPAPELVAPPPNPARNLPDEAEMKRRLAQSLRGMEIDEIEDKIFEARPTAAARYVLAAIGRLGELGREGWEKVHAYRSFPQDSEGSQEKAKRKHLPAFEERGLRYLALMQIEDLNGKAEA